MRTMTMLASVLLLALGGVFGSVADVDANDGAWRLQGTDGKAHALADYRGKWVILEWVNFRCPQVRSLYRERGDAHQTLQQTARSRGMVWFAVNSAAPGQSGSLDLRQATSVLKANKAKPTAMLLDPKGLAGRQFKATLTPEVRVIDPNGRVVYSGAVESALVRQPDGTLTQRQYLNEVLQAVMAGQPAPFASVQAQGCKIPYAQVVGQSGPVAPDFSLRDTSGATRRLSEFRGRWVFLEWVNYDCPFVKKHYNASHRNMQRLQARARELGIVWLSICSSSPGRQGHMQPASVNARIRSLGATPSAYLLDPRGSVGRQYGAKHTPEFRIIDPQGRIRYTGGIDSIASMSARDVARARNYIALALQAIAGGQPIPVTTSRSYGCTVKY